MTTEFKLFLQFFPEVTLPVLLTADEQLLFSANNEALPLDLVSRFLLQKTADSEIDEFTEYVPCFQLPDTAPIYGVVYWRAALLQYDYILASFDANGVLLDAQSSRTRRADWPGSGPRRGWPSPGRAARPPACRPAA